MVIEFSFEPLLTKNLGVVLKPFALATLFHDGKSQEVKMLIDSGADITLIRKSRGEDLGLALPSQDEIQFLGGIAGSAPVVYRKIEMKIEDVTFLARVAWAQAEHVPSVLGRLDVFDKFDIEFKQSDRKILFKLRQ